MSDSFPKPCPNCGHTFTIAELLTMAAGDGVRRFIRAWHVSGEHPSAVLVAHWDFAPHRMTEAVEGDGWDAAYAEASQTEAAA